MKKIKSFLPSVLALSVFLLGTSGWAQPVFFTALHAFTNNPDGNAPGRIFLGVDNALYGVSYMGGDTNLVPNARGIIFRINRDGTGYKVLRSFSLAETGNLSTLTSGNGLSLMQGSDGTLYGTTKQGTNGNGMIFKCNSDGNNFTVLHNCSDNEAGPLTLIQGRDGALYGTGFSSVFTLDTQGGNYNVLHSFPIPDGAALFGQLIQGNDGTLYGTASAGGTNITHDGTIFKLNTNGDNFFVLHYFALATGANPFGGLIFGSDGALYGTASSGSTNGGGTIFKLNTDGGGYQTLYSFGNGLSDGLAPNCSLVQGLGNVLYGTTRHGLGNDLRGEIFKIGTDGGGYNVLSNFGFPDLTLTGVDSFAGLAAGPLTGDSGVFYGTTTIGGAAAHGTIFSVVVNPPVAITPATQAAGSGTVIYWPAWAFSYTLQSTTDLVSGTWTSVSNAVPVAAVQVTNAAPNTFYRLIYQ
jgi:uncharacterized repeat protein (TIGR03803 family)